MKMKHLNLVLLFLLFNPNIVISSSESKRDKIQQIDSLLRLSSKASFDVDIDNSLKYAFEALSQSQSINYPGGKMVAANMIGQAMYNTGNYKEAVEYLAIAENIKTKENRSLTLSQVVKTKGILYFKLGMKDRSLNVLQDALTISEGIEGASNKIFVVSQIYEVLTDVYTDMGINDSVDYYLNKNLELVAQMDSDTLYPSIINIYTRVAEQYMHNNNLKLADDFLTQAFDLIQKHNYQYTSYTHKMKGDLLLASDRADDALDNYYAAKANIAETKLSGELPNLYASMSKAYRIKGYRDSVRYYNEMKHIREREIMSENLNASNTALQILLQKESELKSVSKKRSFLMYLTSIISTLLIIIILVARRRNIIRFFKRIIRGELKSMSQEERLMYYAENDIEEFISLFQEMYPQFHENLIEIHPNLTDSELELCYMTFLDIPTKDIAFLSKIELRSVQTKRSRLRKKINLQPEVDFAEYLKSLSN